MCVVCVGRYVLEKGRKGEKEGGKGAGRRLIWNECFPKTNSVYITTVGAVGVRWNVSRIKLAFL